ncbi:MAG: S8/S53 family peptidase [Deltaproteobacteria bacterium]|nr:S8/S53 family peptidase [Deltaproteobacteria bacterium]
MSITLRLRQTDDLAALISGQQDRQSPDYHRWLTPDEFATSFAPAAEDYRAVADWLQREGFTLRPMVSTTRIDFSGTVRNVERTFSVHMNHYSHRGRTPLANEDPPQLPVEFAGTVDFVRLNTFPLAEPLVRVSTSTRTVTAMAPSDMYTAYNMHPVLDAGHNGSGQTIAVVARSDFNVSDITTFQQQFGVPVRNPVKAFPSTNPGVGAPNGVCRGIRNQREYQTCLRGEEGEVLLDTQWASAMAPGATVLVNISGADIDASLMDIVAHHPDAKVITISFGACERLDRSDINVFGPMYAQAAAQGQAIMVSTGDDGADGCQDGRGRSVNVLASDANVTAVGGTALDPGVGASGVATAYVSERVWNDADGATGGGASTLVEKPAYQDVSGVPADGFRDQPDVSLLASPSNPGYVMVMEGSVAITGGTSASAPSWAGIAAILNDVLHNSGPWNTTLYSLARRQYDGDGAAVFHDVTTGNNSFNRVSGYVAAPGYDLATGLGSPDVAVLVQAVFDTTSITSTPTRTQTPELSTPTPTPLAPTSTETETPELVTPTSTPLKTTCIGDCANSGDVTIEELLTIVNIVLGADALSSCTAADINHDGLVTIDEVVAAVANALNGCPA